MIAVAAEADGAGIGRLRMRRIVDASAKNLIPFIEDALEPRSVVHTDGWLGHQPLEGRDYTHKITFLKDNNKTASELIPRVHLVVVQLKRWLLETHQGGVSLEHLDAYLDEFAFWFNGRESRSRGKLFYRLLETGGCCRTGSLKISDQMFGNATLLNHKMLWSRG